MLRGLGSAQRHRRRCDGGGDRDGIDQFFQLPDDSGAFDTSPNGTDDAFVARLSPGGNALIYSTYLGGGGNDAALALALDATGAATVAGWTNSPAFPTTPGAYATTSSSPNFTDGFVTRLNPTGNALIYSTYLGTAAFDEIHALALDAAGGAIVAGFVGAAPVVGPDYTGVGRLSPGGNALTYSALFGGTGDVVTGLALDATGAATVVGYTFNSSFPTTAGAYDPSWNGGNDAFVARLQSARRAPADGIPRDSERVSERSPRAPGRGACRRLGGADVRRRAAERTGPSLRHDWPRDPAAAHVRRNRTRLSGVSADGACDRILQAFFTSASPRSLRAWSD